VFIFCFYFVSVKLQTDGTIAPAKPLPSAFWRQNRHCLFFLEVSRVTNEVRFVTTQNQIQPIHIGQICWQRSLWRQPGTSAGGATVTPWGHLTYQQVSLKGSSTKG